MNCPKCGRFMRLVGGYSNDHLDSWEDSWTCVTRHPTAAQEARRKALVEEARAENRTREVRKLREIFSAFQNAKAEKEARA